MTLCVAWKVGKGVFLASDSRISTGDKYSDYGIKVIPVPVTIFSPSEEGKKANIAFQSTYGMCFAGSFVGAYVVREFLVIALQKLQFIPNHMELSFNEIVRVVEKLYSIIVNHISTELDYDHSVDFFLSGYCPKETKIKTAKFYIDYGSNFDRQDPCNIVFEDENFVACIGSGEEKYKVELDNIKDKNPIFAPLIALRDLIQKAEVSSVGGNIQSGKFDNFRDFSVSGIVDTVLQDNGLIDKIKYCYAGIEMNGTEFEGDGSGYFFMGSYIDPFNTLKS